MKKIIMTLQLLVALTSLQAQNLSSAKSLEEAKQLIESHIREIDALELLLNTSVNIKISANSGKKEHSYELPFLATNADSIRTAFYKHFESCKLYQQYVYPGSKIILQSSLDDNLVKQYTACDYGSVEYKVTKLIYTDGTTRDIMVDDKSEPNYSLYGIGVMENDMKRLSAIEIAYTEPCCTKKYILNAETPIITTPNGDLRLKAIDDSYNSIDFIATGEFAQEDAIVKVQVLTSNSKPISSQGNSTTRLSIPSAEVLPKLFETRAKLKEILEQYATFKSLDELKEVIERNSPQIKEGNNNNWVYSAKYFCETAPTQVAVFVKISDVITRKAVIAVADNSSDFFIAKDLNKNHGLLDKDGKWFIEPTFRDIREHHLSELQKNDIYQAFKNTNPSDSNNGYSLKDYVLDRQNKQLVPLMEDAVISEAIIPEETYMIRRDVPSEFGGSHILSGVYDIKNRVITIAPDYFNLRIVNDIVVARVNDRQYGAYTIAGKNILPNIFRSMDTDGILIYAKIDNDKNTIAYNKDGKRITPEDVNVEKISEGLILVSIKKDGCIVNAYYDLEGNLFLNADMVDSADSFHGGLAQILKDGYFGFMDKTGKIVIPAIYDYCDRFYKGLALVHDKNNSTYYLINEKGEKVKKLFVGYANVITTNYKELNQREEGDDNAVYIIGNSRFDAYGIQIK